MSQTRKRFRPMLVSEVARVAGDPRETIRTREKQGIYGFERAKGWKRYTDFETIVISVHARLKRASKDDDLAQLGSLMVAKSLMNEWIEDDTGATFFDDATFQRERFLVFWHDADGRWCAEMCDTPEKVVTETNLRLEQSNKAAPFFSIVNLRTMMRETILAIMEIQIEAEEKKSGGKA